MRFLFPLFLILTVSCTSPSSWEQFVRAEDAADGVYEFAIPSEAKESTFNLTFYTSPLDEPLQLEVTWLYSPGDILLTETVWFPAGEHRALYRSGILSEAKEAEIIQVKPIDPPADFRGLGIICKKNDGTR